MLNAHHQLDSKKKLNNNNTKHLQRSTHHNNVLLSSLGGVLGGGHRVALQGDHGLAVTPVRRVLLKFFPNSEASDFLFLFLIRFSNFF